MKNTIYILIIIGLISCEQKDITKRKSKSDILISEISNPEIEKNVNTGYKIQRTSTIENKKDKTVEEKGIEPDFFSIPDSLFSQYREDNSEWFISSDGKNRLYFATYTDYSITTAILTEEKIKEPELVRLLQSDGVQIDNLEKAIKMKQIVSEKGIKLGLSINDVEKIFGVPDFSSKKDGKNVLQWHFTILESGLDDKIGGLKPFIVEGLEFFVEMDFFENRLNKVIYRYEVP